MSSTKTVTITTRGAARLQGGHLWVYAADVVDAGGAQGGDVVAVTDTRGRRLGWALYSDRSQIALRWIAEPDLEITRAFWRERLLRAAAFRQRMIGEAEAYRLVFAESDGLPSLIVDRYGDYFVLQTLSQGMEALKPLWIELLVELFAPRAIVERNDVKVRALEGLPPAKGVLYGTLPERVEIALGDGRFHVDLLHGQKTGAFLDQQENYRAAARYARGRVLDGFCYAGGFAVHLAARAESVLAVDISGGRGAGAAERSRQWLRERDRCRSQRLRSLARAGSAAGALRRDRARSTGLRQKPRGRRGRSAGVQGDQSASPSTPAT